VSNRLTLWLLRIGVYRVPWVARVVLPSIPTRFRQQSEQAQYERVAQPHRCPPFVRVLP